MLDETDRLAMLDAIGIPAAIEGGGYSLTICPPANPDGAYRFFDGFPDSDKPTWSSSAADVQRLGVVAGEAGSVLLFMDCRFRVLAIHNESSGFVIMTMKKI